MDEQEEQQTEEVKSGEDTLRERLGLSKPDTSTEEVKEEVKEEITNDNPLAKLGKSTEETNETPKSIWEERGYESREKFNEDYDSLRGLKTQSEEWTVKEKEYQERLEKAEANNSLFIQDDNLARLNILKNKEDENYDKYARMILGGETSPVNTLIAEEKRKHPNMSDEDIKYRLDKKFGVTEKPDEDAEDYEVERWERDMRISKLEMEDAAKDINSKLMDKFNEIELPSNREPSKVDMIKQSVEAKNAWTPIASQVVKNTGKFDFKVKVGDEELQVDYSLSDEQTATYEKLLLEAVYSGAISGNDDAQNNEIVRSLKATIIEENINDIIQSAVERSSNHINEYWAKKVKNPSQRGVREIEQTSDGKDDHGLAAMRKHLNR